MFFVLYYKIKKEELFICCVLRDGESFIQSVGFGVRLWDLNFVLLFMKFFEFNDIINIYFIEL